MNLTSNTFLLRLALFVILVMHSVPGMFDGGIMGFGGYLNDIGFAPLGVLIAWSIKLSHLACGICLLFEQYIKRIFLLVLLWANIFVFVMGIIMIHRHSGWYVVGGGQNGVEFNFLLIFACLSLIFSNGLPLKK